MPAKSRATARKSTPASTKPAKAAKPAKATKPKSEPSPVKSVADELESLRKIFREVIKQYANRVEAEIAEIRDIVLGLTDSAESLPSSRLHELRDMLTLMRTLQVKQEKGRRKDVKKLDGLVEDLRQFVDAWQ